MTARGHIGTRRASRLGAMRCDAMSPWPSAARRITTCGPFRLRHARNGCSCSAPPRGRAGRLPDRRSASVVARTVRAEHAGDPQRDHRVSDVSCRCPVSGLCPGGRRAAWRVGRPATGRATGDALACKRSNGPLACTVARYLSPEPPGVDTIVAARQQVEVIVGDREAHRRVVRRIGPT